MNKILTLLLVLLISVMPFVAAEKCPLTGTDCPYQHCCNGNCQDAPCSGPEFGPTGITAVIALAVGGVAGYFIGKKKK